MPNRIILPRRPADLEKKKEPKVKLHNGTSTHTSRSNLHCRRSQTRHKTEKKKGDLQWKMATVANVNHDGHPAVNGEMLGNAIEWMRGLCLVKKMLFVLFCHGKRKAENFFFTVDLAPHAKYLIKYTFSIVGKDAGDSLLKWEQLSREYTHKPKLKISI